MNIKLPDGVDKRLVMTLAYGFALGLAVGVLLEASGALEALDRLVGGRRVRPEAPEAAEGVSEPRPDWVDEAGDPWTENPRDEAAWTDVPDHELVAEAELAGVAA